MRNLQPSALQQALERANHPDVLSLALGMPDPELFPGEELAAAAQMVLKKGSQALQYSSPRLRLKEQIAELMLRRDIVCSPEEIFLTTGAQQALTLLGMLLRPQPDTPILVDEAVYPGFRQATDPAVLLPVVREGLCRIDPDALDDAMRADPRPAFLFTMSAGHNPFGTTMSEGSRRELAVAASRLDLPIVEDDVYGLLQYGDPASEPLYPLDPEHVFYVGSFSKILGPALRTAWIIAPKRYHTALSVLKEGCDINTTTTSQAIISEYLELCQLDVHLARLRDRYRERRDLMDRTLTRHFAGAATWQVPLAGFFFWVSSDLFTQGSDLLAEAIAKRMAFVPGSAFAVAGAPHCHRAVRLSFSCCRRDSMDEAIRRLSQAAESRLCQHSFQGDTHGQH